MRVVVRSATICCPLQLQASNDVLMAEAIELQVHDIFQTEGHDGVLFEHAKTIFIDLIRHEPTVDTERALALATQVQTQDFGVMKDWNLAEPTEKFRTAGHFVIDARFWIVGHTGHQITIGDFRKGSQAVTPLSAVPRHGRVLRR